MVKLMEVQSIETVDGQKLVFSGEFFLAGFANYGIAPVNYITQKGYKQVGQTVRGVNYEPRTVSLNLFTTQNKTRTEYWLERQRIFNIVRPNRGLNRLNELTLTIRREDGTKRYIKGFYAGGLELTDVDDNENAFRISTTLNIFCPNPIWYDSSTTVLSPATSQGDQLVFPATFPIRFGTSGAVYSTGDLNYEGSFRAYPTITIDGPYTTATITLNPTGEQLILLNAILTGEQRIITLGETGFTIVDGNGDDAFNDLQVANLVDFYIKPSDQFSAGETQSISTNLLNGVNGVSGVTYEYNTAYIGI